MTRATAPVAAEIIARRPPTIEIVTAMVNEANRPIAGSTPAMIEKEIASGISARATTRPAEDLGAPDLGVVQPVGLEAAQPRGGADSSRRQGDAYLSCSGTPRQAGACGSAREAGRHPAGGPRGGPEVV